MNFEKGEEILMPMVMAELFEDDPQGLREWEDEEHGNVENMNWGDYLNYIADEYQITDAIWSTLDLIRSYADDMN